MHLSPAQLSRFWASLHPGRDRLHRAGQRSGLIPTSRVLFSRVDARARCRCSCCRLPCLAVYLDLKDGMDVGCGTCSLRHMGGRPHPASTHSHCGHCPLPAWTAWSLPTQGQRTVQVETLTYSSTHMKISPNQVPAEETPSCPEARAAGLQPRPCTTPMLLQPHLYQIPFLCQVTNCNPTFLSPSTYPSTDDLHQGT